MKTENSSMRPPVFKVLREDKLPEKCMIILLEKMHILNKDRPANKSQ